MSRSSHRGLVALTLLLGQLLGTPPPSHAAPSDRKTLVLRGRVTDADGWPVAGARVLAQGTRRVKASTDDAGQFVLNLSLGQLSELAREPFSVRVRAEQRGWRLALPGGDREMGLDLRVTAGESGVAQCEVRSNQKNVGGATVRALTADGDAVFVANMNFIGVKGEEIGAPPELDLPVVDRVTLLGVRAPDAPQAVKPIVRPPETRLAQPETTEAKRVPDKPARPETTGPKTAPVKSARPEAKEPQPGPGKAARPETIEPKGAPVKSARPETTAATAPRKLAPTDATALKPPKHDAKEDKAIAREEAKRLREEVKEQERIARRQREEEKAREKEDARARRAAEDELHQSREAHERRWRSLGREVQLIAGATDTTTAPPVSALNRDAGTLPRPQPRLETVAPRRLAHRRDTVVVTPPRELPEPPPAAAATRTTPAAAQGVRSSPVRPLPVGEPRLRTAPLVIRTPAPQPPASGDSCTCRIEGTVEVDSDRPLPARTQVAISLGWYPAIADTVELFMGSPRGFRLPMAPCGPQRLRLINLGSQRLDVASREAMAIFRCESGGLRQFRIVLRPH